MNRPRIGVGWYKASDWARLREISDDADNLEETFEEWEKNALSAVADFMAAGQIIEKVFIDPEKLLSWSLVTGKNINGETRSEFVSRTLEQMDEKT